MADAESVHQPNPPDTDSSRPKTGVMREALTTLAIIASALVLAGGVIAFVFQSYQVSGESMQETLHNGDHLIIWKVPRTWARITGHPYVPQRGDIIVFNESAGGLDACGDDQARQLIKRVIGLPGDHVVVTKGAIEIFNKQYPRGFFPDRVLPYHNHITETTSGDINLTLAGDQIFVAGDNRGNSCDSRVFGPVNLSGIVGKLALRVLPIDGSKVF